MYVNAAPLMKQMKIMQTRSEVLEMKDMTHCTALRRYVAHDCIATAAPADDGGAAALLGGFLLVMMRKSEIRGCFASP
jgi:hypothetical protein